MIKLKQKNYFIFLLLIFALLLVSLFYFLIFKNKNVAEPLYIKGGSVLAKEKDIKDVEVGEVSLFSIFTKKEEVASTTTNLENTTFHIKTPEKVKGVYMSSWVAGTPEIRKRLIDLIESTEINTVLIDVKDSSGVVVFDILDEDLKKEAVIEERIKNVDELIKTLHEKNIYIIGRVAVFQDPGAAKKFPERAIKSKKTGGLWKDNKGLAWTDAGSQAQWEYNLQVAKYAYGVGFDEIGFDYIRFPSDGNISDMDLPFSFGKDKVKVVSDFFAFMGEEMRKEGIPSSADVFGLTTSYSDGMGIGQTLEPALIAFDYVSPMSYPSHFGAGYKNIKNPDASPYLTILESYKDALYKIDKMAKLENWRM